MHAKPWSISPQSVHAVAAPAPLRSSQAKRWSIPVSQLTLSVQPACIHLCMELHHSLLQRLHVVCMTSAADSLTGQALCAVHVALTGAVLCADRLRRGVQQCECGRWRTR